MGNERVMSDGFKRLLTHHSTPLIPHPLSPWRLFAFIVVLVVVTPLAVILFSLFNPQPDIWQHFVRYLFPEQLRNTFILCLGVGIGATALGVSLAWLVAIYDFPARKFFSWALMLPLAVPGYVLAFIAIGLLDYAGPVQSWLRQILTAEKLLFPEIRSTGGVVLVMTFALYPYIFLLAKNAFLTQGKRTLEIAQSFGLSVTQGFWKVALPMARPWIIAGLTLVLMESLADFGTVAVFNFNTFTVGIYKAWFGMFSLQTAFHIASALLFFVFLVMVLEQSQRTKLRYTQASHYHPAATRINLTGRRRWFAFAHCALVLAIGFLIPVGQLLAWMFQVFSQEFNPRYWQWIMHSLALAASGTLLILFVALPLAYVARRHHDFITQTVLRLATLGYGLPGTLLAVSIFVVIAWLDEQLITFAKTWFQMDISAVLKGTVITMMSAYLIRFLAVAYNPVESALKRITRSQDEVARSFGVSGVKMLWRVHLPLLRAGLVTAGLLVFVDIMKEMPITLMTRPFGWDTLATRIFEMTSIGEWENAALPALALVIIGLVPLFLLTQHER